MDEKLKRDLIEIVGEANVADSLIDRVSLSYDASEHRGRPEAGVSVRNTEQVSKIIHATG